MAMLWMDGFDWIDPAATYTQTGYAIASRYISHNLPYTTPQGRAAAGRQNGTGIRLYHYGEWFRTPAIQTVDGPDKVYIGFALKFDDPPYTVNLVKLFRLNSEQANFQICADGSAIMSPMGGWFDAGLRAGRWYYIELYFRCHRTLGAYECRINGVTKSSGGPGDMATQDADGWSNIYFYGAAGQVNGCVYDDIYVCDDQGAVNNGFLGDVKIPVLWPKTDHTTEWEVFGETLHNDAVDDGPVAPDEAEVWDDTDYVYAGADDSSLQDLYEYDLLPSEYTDATIQAVQLATAARTTNPQAVTLKTQCLSVAAEVNVTEDVLMWDEYGLILGFQETDPNTGSLWTPTNLGLAKFGVEVG